MNIFVENIDDDKHKGSEKLPDLIEDRLYVGDMFVASDKENLNNLGITHILIFASYIEPLYPKDFVYKQIQVHDLPNFNIRNLFEECYR
jgi:hypothetical protein